jgi:hypothetical protein
VRVARLLTPAGLVLGGVGLVLLVVQVVRTLGDATLGTVGTVLLWLGFGLLAAGVVVLFLAMLRTAPDAGGDASAAVEPGETAAS